jgi:hypothetical protein
MNFRVLFLLFIVPALHAELPPSAYEAMQAKAPEQLEIEVLRVSVEPGESPTQKNVHVVALTTKVVRTGCDLKPDEIINILYSIRDHPQGWFGPGEVPIPVEKAHSVAYLTRMESGDFEPAAGRMSFSNF